MDIRVYLRPLRRIPRAEPVPEPVKEHVSGPVPDHGTLVPVVPGGDDDGVGEVHVLCPDGPDIWVPVPDPDT